MADLYFNKETFSKEDLAECSLVGNEYEHCTFENCELANADLLKVVFSDCQFINCNLSNAQLTQTAWRGVTFNQCKMLGLHFGDGNPFGLSFRFENCILNHCSFYKVNAPATLFKNTQLQGADFTDSNFSKAAFEACDMLDANFDNTNLEEADLRTAIHFRIDPLSNKIKRARFSSHNLAGLLTPFNIIIE